LCTWCNGSKLAWLMQTGMLCTLDTPAHVSCCNTRSVACCRSR
jgi:hypothetical protein